MSNTTYKETPLALADRLSRLEDAIQMAVLVDEAEKYARINVINSELEIVYTVYPPTTEDPVYRMEAQVAVYPSAGSTQLGTVVEYAQVVGKIMGHFFETYTEAKDTGQLDR
jgi:Icc-related predicted phosphoesterase